MPCTTPGPWTCPITDKTTTYDALDRVTGVSDSGGGWTAYSYANNDVYVNSGPAPGFNGGFEQGLTGWSCDSGAQLITDPSRAHSGSNYVQLSTSTGSACLGPSVAVSPGDSVTFGGWVYRESGTDYTNWAIGAYTSAGQPIDNTGAQPVSIGNSTWTY